jgi:hypothetical protein
MSRADWGSHFRTLTLLAQRWQGDGMERADWLDERVDSADARFLMVTAITHHRFSSPIWGAREVRKLQAELAEITKHAADILREHQRTAGPAGRRGTSPQWRGVMAALHGRPQWHARPQWRGVMAAPAW